MCPVYTNPLCTSHSPFHSSHLVTLFHHLPLNLDPNKHSVFAESLQNWRKNDGKSFQLGIGSGKEHSPWDKQGEERTMVMGC
ncbi:hypothetical protein CC2G_008427 [Coprinopsis cinerea AmutBmut pab1-1]|nr:hypothetical protein CC2G_008427 [Coprinopsis cinerea AmutBmut pab1-1]